jgi:hypothetical protein
MWFVKMWDYTETERPFEDTTPVPISSIKNYGDRCIKELFHKYRGFLNPETYFFIFQQLKRSSSSSLLTVPNSILLCVDVLTGLLCLSFPLGSILQAF